jgi:ribosomal protein L11 methyltransferase
LIAFTIKKDISEGLAWAALLAAGIRPLYSYEDESGIIEIVGEGHLPLEMTALSFVEKVRSISNETDWQAQWNLHVKNYLDGYLHVPLPNGRTVKLAAGPGFGDLSHPTTELVLDLMLKHVVPHAFVVDIGCGSGILALCAEALGANPVWAVDIDEEALRHTRSNAELNGMQHIRVGYPEELVLERDIPVILTLNMISSEQEIVKKALPPNLRGHALTSGILKEQEDEYLALTASWRWKIQEVREKEGWLGFVFLIG